MANWNCSQKDHIIKFMVKHGTGRSRLDADLWSQLASEMNNLGPPSKEVPLWRKSWIDFKYMTRKKFLAIPPATRRQRKLRDVLFDKKKVQNDCDDDDRPLKRKPAVKVKNLADLADDDAVQKSGSVLAPSIAEYLVGTDGVLDGGQCKVEVEVFDDPLAAVFGGRADTSATPTIKSSTRNTEPSRLASSSTPDSDDDDYDGANQSDDESNTSTETPPKASRRRTVAGSSRPKSKERSTERGVNGESSLYQSVQSKILHSLEKNTLKRERNQLLKEQNELLRKMHYSTESYRREMLAQAKESTDIQRRKLELMEREAQRRSDANYF